MHWLRGRLPRTEIAKTAKQRSLIAADNFRQAVRLILLLRRTGDFRQAVNLIRALNKTGDFRQAAGLIRLLRRTGNLREAIKLVRSLHQKNNFRFVFPLTPGHYSSPLPDSTEVLARSQVLFDRSTVECPGIDLREEAQLELLESFSRYYDDLPFPTQPGNSTRYYYENWWFGYGDAITLYSVMRHYEPRRVIEVGSGYSSAAMLEVNDLFLDGKIRFTFVEPHPQGERRLLQLLTQEDQSKHTILRKQVQELPLDIFEALSANDILFIDSSHVGKVGSDVNYILFRILPKLKAGVIVHFHDIYWPFEYPQQWILEAGIAWNEAYFLHAFLQYNQAFEIMYFNSFLAQHHKDVLRRKMPLSLKVSPLILKGGGSSSLWLKKVA